MSTSNLPDAYAEASAAIAAADSGANEEWKAEMDALIEQYARSHQTFSSDDLIFDAEINVIASTRDLRALGAVFTRARKAGLIEWYGEMTPSKRRHVTPIRVWTSLVYANDDTRGQGQSEGTESQGAPD